MADFREMMACLEQVPKAHPPIAVGNALAHVACRDRPWRPRRSVHRPRRPSAEGNEIPPVLDRWAELIRRQRQFNLPQPDRCRPPRSRPTTRPRTALSRSAMPFCSAELRFAVLLDRAKMARDPAL